MLTDVAAVEAGFGTPEARALRDVRVDELRELTFAAGSMGPKVEAACRFAERTGGLAGDRRARRRRGDPARRTGTRGPPGAARRSGAMTATAAHPHRSPTVSAGADRVAARWSPSGSRWA